MLLLAFVLWVLFFLLNGALLGLSGGWLLLWVLAGTIGMFWWSMQHAKAHAAERLREREARRQAGKSNCPFLR